MKTIEKFENDERLVMLKYDDSDKRYFVSLLTRDGKNIGATYKSRYYAKRKFNDYKNNPLKALGAE
jgi:hypothetical protein